jgi:hypothetical protein
LAVSATAIFFRNFNCQFLEPGDLRHLDVRVKGAEAEHEVIEAARVTLPGCVAHGLSTALVL